MHSLIYLAFVARLGLSLATLVIYHLWPGSDLALVLIDKNHWAVALTNDLLGLAILLGIALAVYQRWVQKPSHVLTQEQDNVALAAIGLLVISGFALEGGRILVTQVPDSIAVYAVGGYAVSQVLAVLPFDWQGIYGSLWYVHAATWAVIIAYLPFGKLKHVFTTPLSLMLETKTQPHTS